MSSINYINKILKLKDFSVEKIENKHNNIKIYGKMVVKEQTCPCCGHKTTRIHDYRKQEIKDISAFGKTVTIILNKRRYLCTNCGKRFIESVPFLAKYQRRTKRLNNTIIDKLRDIVSFSHVAKEMDISVSTVIRIFDNISYTKPDLPEVIGIDEFKGNTGNEKYQCILTDIKNKKVIDILPNRYECNLIDYFKSLNRNNTKYFVSDMWRTYSNIANTYFKKAVYVVDKYHFVRQVTWAFEGVRKEIQKKFQKDRRIYIKHSKRLLLKRYKNLKDEEKQALTVILNYNNDLYKAYLLKEDFYNIMESKNSEEAKKAIGKWIYQAENSNISKFTDCANTMRNWITGISNSFKCSYTNGFTEGCNNKIKILKRNAYGYRNFKRFRNRILHIFS